MALPESHKKPDIDTLFDAVHSMPPLIPKRDRRKQSITSVGVGGFLKFQDKTWRVEELSRYDECYENTWTRTGDTAFEFKLLCLQTGEIGWMEWAKDDHVEVYLTTEEIRFRGLRDDGNETLEVGDLEEIIDEEDSVFYSGKEFRYDDDWPAWYHRGCGDAADKVSFYEFYAEDGACLTIERWDGGEIAVFLSREVRVRDIEILATKS